MSDNVRIIVAMIGGLLCGVSITLAIWAMTLARRAVREANELERMRGVNESAARPLDMPIDQFVPWKATDKNA